MASKKTYEERRARGWCGWSGCPENSGAKAYCRTHMAYFSKTMAEKRNALKADHRCPLCGDARPAGSHTITCGPCLAYLQARRKEARRGAVA